MAVAVATDTEMEQQLKDSVELTKLSQEQEKKLRAVATQTVDEMAAIGASKIDLREYHEKYVKFGHDKIKDLLPDTKGDSRFNVSMREMENGSDATREVGSIMMDMSDSLSELRTDKPIRAPKNALLRKIYDPVKNFMNRARKTGAVLQSCMDALDSSDKKLAADIVEYEAERERAKKLVVVAKEQAALGEIIAEQLREKIDALEKSGENPDLVIALKSECLAAITRSSLDLLSIANAQMKYITAINLLLKGHEQARDEIYRAKTVSFTEFQTAVRIAQGIATQEQAIKMSAAMKEASSKLDVRNAQNLQESSKSIIESSQSMVTDVESIRKATDIMCDTIEEMRTSEAESADKLRAQIPQVKASIEYMQRRLAETEKAESEAEKARTQLKNTTESK